MQPATVLHAECVCAVLCRYRRGLLSACIPSQLLGLWTVEEFQKHVSGSPEVPIDKMKAQTRFSVRSPPVLPLALDLDLSASYAFPLPPAPVFFAGRWSHGHVLGTDGAVLPRGARTGAQICNGPDSVRGALLRH